MAQTRLGSVILAAAFGAAACSGGGGGSGNGSGGSSTTGGANGGGTGGRTGANSGGTGVGTPTGGAGTGGNAAPATGGGAANSGGRAAGAGTPNTGGSAAGGAPASTGVTVQLGQTRQTMDGFGVNDSWHPAYTAAQADQLFSATAGIGLTILRVGMGSDGNAISANIFPDIMMARSRGATTFIGSVWSPPANCKTNNSINDGGHLTTGACYDSWSTTIAAFPAKVRAGAGVDLFAMSPANEPDFASCGLIEPCNGNYPTTLFTDVEMVNFVKVVGPKLHALNPPVKLLGPEASEWLHNWTNMSACCSDPGGRPSSNPLMGMGYDYGHALYRDTTAWGLLDIMGVHQYDSQVAQPWPTDVPQMKPVWQTEMSGVKWWPEQGPSSDIANGVVVAGWIHDAIVNGLASAWLWWWYQAQGTNDNEGLLLQNGTVAKRLYTLGNFSKFVRPGYTRVDVTGTAPANVLLSAYKATDGTVVVVAINKGATAASVPIAIAGGTAPASLTPWVTSTADNLAAKTAVPVTTGSFTATLAAATVTTFVGR